MGNELLTVKELRKILKCGRDRCYSLMRSSAFPSTKIAGRYYVNKQSLEEWMIRNAYKEFQI